MAEPQRPTHLVVVAGTGTDVGKTWVSARLLERLRDDGWTVSARKPAQSFDEVDDPATLDSAVLAGASGEPDTVVCPAHRRYAVALAPPMAADALDLGQINLGDLVAEVGGSWAPKRADIGVVELAGGPRSPIAHDGDGVSLAVALRPDTVIVVADADLGALNSIRLSVGVLDPVASVIVHLNRFDSTSPLHAANLAWLVDNDALAVTTSIDTLAIALAERVATFCGHCGRRSDECDGGCARPFDPDRYCGRCGRRMAVTITPVDSVARCRIHGQR